MHDQRLASRRVVEEIWLDLLFFASLCGPIRVHARSGVFIREKAMQTRCVRQGLDAGGEFFGKQGLGDGSRRHDFAIRCSHPGQTRPARSDRSPRLVGAQQ